MDLKQQYSSVSAESETICPYTGIRSFTEEESLYFKGRDEHIQRVIEQLEQKKFLMVTGASGDGKSSLIFAGLVPQARAGFFSATYTNWQVASFRPERSPLTNMAKALASAMRLEGSTTVENELSHGFSSLMEIYKSSSLYIDQRDQAWESMTEDQRMSTERNAGNLLVIVDQFEEFFTNPENFVNGVPSQDSRLVLNILLETVKLALRNDLPIYIVFTMRSDYIGQCAAFRGLPEFIGFSQFFVPRLQRKELQQVIEEPAVLSGNSISKRFVDRLIYDMEDTEDRLPILQHVLKEVWKAADLGREQMDLIHYAMVGGMPGDKLPTENLERFKEWESTLPSHRRNYLKTASLSNVLDIHATRLYDEAADTYNREHSTQISERDAKRIIAITFACLTRIDENRAVRNRMTLQEITRIINVPSITLEMVDEVLRPFRSADNTLVRPFLSDDSAREPLKPETVLDITHEALIRNWKLLNRWSAKEFEYYNTFLDFKKQLQRWTENGKSDDYLLPIGPLTYFEKWFKDCRPNVHWINSYNSQSGDPTEKLLQSQETLDHSRHYMRSSARKFLLARTFMKYGARRITITAAGILLLIVSFFLVYSWWNRRNDVVVEKIIAEGKQLLSTRDANPASKALFMIHADRLEPGSLEAMAGLIPDRQKRIETLLVIPEAIFARSKYSDPPLLLSSMGMAENLIRDTAVPPFENVKAVENYLNNWNDLLNLQLNYLYFKPNQALQSRMDRNARLLGKFIFTFFANANPAIKWEKKSIHIAVAQTLNLKGLSPDSLSVLVASISPFEGGSGAVKKFDLLFPKAESIIVGVDQHIEHNGGYEILANVYAALGQSGKALRCMDTITKYQRQYNLNVNNSLNIATYFVLNDHMDAFQEFVNRYASRAGIKPYEYMRGFANQAGVFGVGETMRSFKHGNKNPNIAMIKGEELERVFDFYQISIQQDLKEGNEGNFELALLYKHHGLMLFKKSIESRQPLDAARISKLFDQAFEAYNKLPVEFLDEIVRSRNQFPGKRKLNFIDPDHSALVPDIFSSQFQLSSYGDAFFSYVNTHGLWGALYKDQVDYNLLNKWVARAYSLKDLTLPFAQLNSSYQNFPPPSYSSIVAIDSLIHRSGFEKQLDNSWVRMLLLRKFLAAKETEKAIVQLDRVDYDKMGSGGPARFNFIEMLCLQSYATKAAKELIAAQYGNRVSRFVNRFRRRENRVVAYAQLGIASYENGFLQTAQAYLDSVNHEFQQSSGLTEFSFRSGNDVRNPVVKLLTLIKREKGRREVLDLTGSMADQKLEGIATGCRTYAGIGEYYEALSMIPDLANPNDRLYLYSQILFREASSRKREPSDKWKEYDEEHLNLMNFVLYVQDLN